MNIKKVYVGIDVHAREHKVAIIPIHLLAQPGGTWRKTRPLTIRNNITDFEKLDALINSHITNNDEVAIAVDHTGGHYSEPLTYFLQAKGYRLFYLETKGVKAARERFLDEENKSDVIDASSAAYLLYLRDLHGLSFRISATTPELSSRAAVLNSLVLQRGQFNKLANQATNRLHQLLTAVFPEGESQYFHQLMKVIPYYPTPKDILATDGLKDIETLSRKVRDDILELAAKTVGIPTDIYGWLIKDLTIQRSQVLAKRDELTCMLRKEVATHPYGHILLSFPFLGEIAAATIIGIIKDIGRWPDEKKFKKALGVYNSLTQSGSGPSRTKRGREGSRHGRRVLFQVCFGCIRTNAADNDFKDYYLRQVAKGKPRMKALFSAMGKLAEIVYHCLKTGEPYQYQGKLKTGTGRKAE